MKLYPKGVIRMRRMKGLLCLGFILVFLLISTGVGAETIFETFSTDMSGGWIRTGDECQFQYNDQGYMYIDIWHTPHKERLVKSLSREYYEDTEFWVEWDWQSESIYAWTRGLYGVFHSQSDNDSNAMGIGFQRRKSADVEVQRGIAIAFDGTQKYFDVPDFTVGEGFVGRSKLHYYQNEDGEGIVELEIWDLLSGRLVASKSGTVLAPGKEVSFDVFGIGNAKSSDIKPQYHDAMKVDNLYFSTERPCDAYFKEMGKERPVPSWIK